MGWEFYFFIGIMALALGAVIWAILNMKKQRDIQDYIESMKQKAVVKKVYESQTKQGRISWFAQFCLADGMLVTLQIPANIAQSLYVDDIGMLVYRKSRFLFYEKLPSSPRPLSFFESSSRQADSMKIIVDSLRFGISINASDNKRSDLETMLDYINHLDENRHPHFFSLEADSREVLEVSGDGKSNYYDLRLITNTNNFEKQAFGKEEVKHYVMAFYNGEDMLSKFTVLSQST